MHADTEPRRPLLLGYNRTLMKFQQLLHGVETLGESSTLDPDITNIAYDSRLVQPGGLFVAMKGEATDGNKFIDAAIAKGAVAVVSDAVNVANWPHRSSVAVARVSHGRQALARVSANFYDHPARKLALTGITGTNGKTTTTFLLEGLLRHVDRRNILVGTVEYHVADEVRPSPHTTPESLDLHALFAEGVQKGTTEVVMEVSSHALAQRRVFGLQFDVAVFTNLTRDHLDYHSTMEDYFGAKRLLFVGTGGEVPRVAVVNADDPFGQMLALASEARSKVVRYGLRQGEIRAEKVNLRRDGSNFDLVHPQGRVSLRSQLVGEVNVYNLLAAAAAAHARGCTWEQIAEGAATLRPVPGRFETVHAGQPFTVVVDYAHTDDALKNLISLARQFVSQSRPHGRVITLFGCGGDRDRKKRPLMGRAAGEGSDFVVLTSDNPRSEDPQAIIEEAKVGLDEVKANYVTEADRGMAIAIALKHAQPEDIVLLAGKGHEKVQVMKDGDHPFDDVQVATQLLQSMYREASGSTKTPRSQKA